MQALTSFLTTVSGKLRPTPVSSSAPLPVTDAVTGAAVGEVDDAAYTTGDGTVVSILKGLFGYISTRVGVVPQMTSAGHGSVQTNATGTNYTTLTSQACKQVTIANNTGVALEVRQGGSGVAFPVFDQTTFTFYGLANANELSVRRVDTSNTQVTAQYRWEA